LTSVPDAAEHFPDTNATVHEMLAEGDLMASRITVSGTHKGNFVGVPPTGKKVDIEAIDMVRIKIGKIEEHWGLTDVMGLIQQLGVMPGQPQ
jgi:C-1 hydroxylase